MRRILVAVLAAASFGAAALAVPAVSSAAPVYISGQSDGYLYQHPSRLGLWVSDYAGGLHWSHWGGKIASAYGYVTEHASGHYWHLLAGFAAYNIRRCGGHRVYTGLAVAFGPGRARDAHFSWRTCSLAGP